MKKELLNIYHENHGTGGELKNGLNGRSPSALRTGLLAKGNQQKVKHKRGKSTKNPSDTGGR